MGVYLSPGVDLLVPKTAHIQMTKNSAAMVKTAQRNKKLHQLLSNLDEGDLLSYRQKQMKFTGEKKGSHILCHCCNTEVSASQFEAHAGFASRRKPYSYIYVESTGELLHNSANRCSGCQQSFLTEGASQTQNPDKWLCTNCKNNICKEASAERTAVAPVKQIGDMPVPSVKSNIDQIGETSCCLCGKTDFAKTEFGVRTILLCDQCEREYHVGCYNEANGANLKGVPEGDWFCCPGCQHVHSSLLQYLLKEHELSAIFRTKSDVTWMLLKGPVSGEIEGEQLLSQAIGVLKEEFGDLRREATGKPLLCPIVYGEKDDHKTYRGMHCIVLLVNSEVVVAAAFRVFGQELAEMPLVSTHPAYQRKGYFREFCIVFAKLCEAFGVKKIVLPATEGAMGLWLKLGFEKMNRHQLSVQRSTFPDVVEFEGAKMMHNHIAPGELAFPKSWLWPQPSVK